MLKELFQYYTTPCKPLFRKMGYLNELIATSARAARVKPYWRSHLINSKEIIEQAVRSCAAKRKVVILGAGNLLDIPIDKLAAVFSEVVLVDVACSLGIREACQRHINVKWHGYDLTGIADKLLTSKKTPLPKVATSFPQYLADCDLLISANLLSQLACCPGRWLIKHNHPCQVVKELECQLVQAHIASLRQIAGQVCLITDVQHHYLNAKGELLHCNNIIDPAHTPVVPDEQWSWTIAPLGEISHKIQMISTVVAWSNWL